MCSRWGSFAAGDGMGMSGHVLWVGNCCFFIESFRQTSVDKFSSVHVHSQM